MSQQDRLVQAAVSRAQSCAVTRPITVQEWTTKYRRYLYLYRCYQGSLEARLYKWYIWEVL